MTKNAAVALSVITASLMKRAQAKGIFVNGRQWNNTMSTDPLQNSIDHGKGLMANPNTTGAQFAAARREIQQNANPNTTPMVGQAYAQRGTPGNMQDIQGAVAHKGPMKAITPEQATTMNQLNASQQVRTPPATVAQAMKGTGTAVDQAMAKAPAVPATPPTATAATPPTVTPPASNAVAQQAKQPLATPASTPLAAPANKPLAAPANTPLATPASTPLASTAPSGITTQSSGLGARIPKMAQARHDLLTPEEKQKRKDRVRKIVGTLMGMGYGGFAGTLLGTEVFKQPPARSAAAGAVLGALGGLGVGTAIGHINKYTGEDNTPAPQPIQIIIPPGSNGNVVRTVQRALTPKVAYAVKCAHLQIKKADREVTQSKLKAWIISKLLGRRTAQELANTAQQAPATLSDAVQATPGKAA